MSIFGLHEQVLADCRDLVRSFFMADDTNARAVVECFLVEEARPWPDFLLHFNHS